MDIELAEDNTKPLIDPIMGNFMGRYLYAKNPNRYLEYSYLSSRVWFDAGELEDVCQRIGVFSILKIFSEYFQKELRNESLKETIEEQYASLLSPHFSELKKLKEALIQSNQLKDAIHFLKI